MSLAIVIDISDERVRYLESRFLTDLLEDSVEIDKTKYPFHQDSLTSFMLEVGVPLIYAPILMRMNGLVNMDIPKDRRFIKIMSKQLMDTLTTSILKIKIDKESNLDDKSPIL